jgi:hypothetical protein
MLLWLLLAFFDSLDNWIISLSPESIQFELIIYVNVTCSFLLDFPITDQNPVVLQMIFRFVRLK